MLKYLFPLWTGLFIYALLSFLYGGMGFSAYYQLENEKAKQEANVANLKQINRELDSSMNSLLYDKDTLAVYAREQGYASTTEKFIRIVGLGPSIQNRNSAGEVVIAAEPQYVPDQTLRIIAFCTVITIVICMAMFDLMKYLRER